MSSGKSPFLTSREEEANMGIIFDKYKDRVSTLPKEKGWIKDNQYLYQGFWYYSKYRLSVETVMAAQDSFEAQPLDIFLATHPKSGTTWLKALAFVIVNRAKYKDNSSSIHPLLTTHPQLCVPYIEAETFQSTAFYSEGHSPRLFATHIPYPSLPRSILTNGCRIVYICRNPKDVLISHLHFINDLMDKSHPRLTLEEAFELFSRGVVQFGPYWDHVIGYHKACVEQPGRILFLKYEDMKKYATLNVKKLAEFLGYPFTEKEEADGVVEEVVELCSFEKLKEVSKKEEKHEGVVSGEILFREGKVGDSSNHLTPEMIRILDEITNKKFHGLDLSF